MKYKIKILFIILTSFFISCSKDDVNIVNPNDDIENVKFIHENLKQHLGFKVGDFGGSIKVIKMDGNVKLYEVYFSKNGMDDYRLIKEIKPNNQLLDSISILMIKHNFLEYPVFLPVTPEYSPRMVGSYFYDVLSWRDKKTDTLKRVRINPEVPTNDNKYPENFDEFKSKLFQIINKL